MQLKKQLRKMFNKEKPCRHCGKDHATGQCPDRLLEQQTISRAAATLKRSW